jgi:pimeloyl-ACP methyl ester carboxylesterase
MITMYRIILSLFGFLYCTAAVSQNIAGNWEGTLQVQGTEIPIIFHITKDNTGKHHATFDSPVQKAYGLPCSDVMIQGDSVILMMQLINGRYAAKLNNDQTQLTGNWQQGDGSLPLQVTRTGNVATTQSLKRPQTPKPPYPYRSEDVEYDNADRSVHFGANFTVPLPDPNVDYFRAPIYPTVILITGSGPQDRDETIFEHKPFAVIADHLTKQGIAVLRVDDRGMGKTTGDFSRSTTADFVNDVEAGIEYLKTRTDVDVDNIGLIGHSEGGVIAHMLASKRKDVRYIVLLAGPGINILDMMEQQSADVMASAGISKTDIDLYRPLYKNMVTAIIHAKDTTQASKKAMAVFKAWQKNVPATTVKNTTGVEGEKGIIDFTNSFINQLNSPWFKYFFKINPEDYLAKTHCPVLALNGEKDIQVAAKQNLAGIKNALEKNKNKNFKTIELAGLNHLFQHCKTCTVEEYGELEESFDTETLGIITDWIKTGRFN